MGIGEPWQGAKTGPAGAAFNLAVAVVKKAHIAAELVDQKAGDHRRVLRVHHHLGADNLGDDAATVDIAGQHDGHACGAGKAHVGKVVLAQVHLSRAPRPFDDNQIGALSEDTEAFEHGGHQPCPGFAEVTRLQGAVALPLHDHLRPAVGFGFQQDGVHMHRQGPPAGNRLQGLCAANLSAIVGDGGVVRHVLRFERRDGKPPTRGRAAQARHQHGFPHIRSGALDHDSAGGHGGTSWFSCSPWCQSAVIPSSIRNAPARGAVAVKSAQSGFGPRVMTAAA